MLLRLRLRDFVIVDQAEIEFGPGFTVLSGETGAGKSILLDALALAMGGRADSGVVREDMPRADVAAEFSVEPAIESWLGERALGGDPGIVLLRRVIEADGRSKALINGHPATAAQLRELGERLIDIHGQHAAQSMLRRDGQRDLLDAFGQLADPAKTVAERFAQWRALAASLEAAERDSRTLALERDRIGWQVSELAQLKLAPGEWERLSDEQKRLEHAASLIEGARVAGEALAESDEAVATRLYQTLQRLRPLAAIDARLAAVVEMLEAASIQVDEAASSLAAYAEKVDLDPERLQEIDRKLSAAFTAARKLRIPPETIPAELAQLQSRLAELDASQDIEGLRARTDAARVAYGSASDALTKRRKAAARQLSSGVSRHLQSLGMAGGKLEVAIEAGEPSASGTDRVEFRIAGHAGATPRALAKVASGGELSRVGLAIAVLAAQANPVPTLIFDEADAGVGGAVAEVVGTLMRELGVARQVLCVTHLPQVAAKAHQQFAVSKETRGGRTFSRIERLDRGARVEEIARMLGGMEITATTRRHARELLAET